MSKILHRGGSALPEIRICDRSSDAVVSRPRLQMALFSTLLVGSAVFTYVETSRYEHLVSKKEAVAARAESAKTSLEEDLVRLRGQVSAIAGERDRSQRQAAESAEQTQALRTRLSKAQTGTETLSAIEQALGRERARNAALGEQLADSEGERAIQEAKLMKIEGDRAAEAARLAQYKANLEQVARDLVQLRALSTHITIKRGAIDLNIADLWQKLMKVQIPLFADELISAGTLSSPELADATSADSPRRAAAAIPAGNAAALEAALRSAGVNVARILAKIGNGEGEGGPFVAPPSAAEAPGGAASAAKLAAIEQLAKNLPIVAPLAHYQIGSGFGPRLDPFNHHAAFHTGVDMDAPYSSPVYATAAGTVIYTGWLGDYGQVVEIDHGSGIVTLYGHLRRCLVTTGQSVQTQAEIGLVGSTGRSTGPHVHYEVRVDGQPQDPQKFLALARLLPAAVTGKVTPAVGGPAGNSR